MPYQHAFFKEMNAFSFRQFCEHFKCISIFLNFSRPAFTCSKLTTERLEQGMKYVPSQLKWIQHTGYLVVILTLLLFQPIPSQCSLSIPPLKNQETKVLSDVFRGNQKTLQARNGLRNVNGSTAFLLQRLEDFRLILKLIFSIC